MSVSTIHNLRTKSFEIHLQNQVRTIPVSLAWLGRQTAKMLKRLQYKQAAVSILLVGDREIRALNQRYLGHDWVTDVLAFGYRERSPLKKKRIFFGDIVISLPVTQRQAKKYGNSFRYELCFYVCHGLLHLKGFRDKTARERLRMERKQKNILKRIQVSSS
jgi:probable rRNA maturation factor